MKRLLVWLKDDGGFTLILAIAAFIFILGLLALFHQTKNQKGAFEWHQSIKENCKQN